MPQYLLGWPRSRRSTIAFFVLLLLCFIALTNIALQDVESTALLLEALHDPSPPTGSNAPRILLVSAMFPLAKSKHSKEDYEQWISQFLRPVTTDVYFFTPESFAATVQRARGNGTITINTTYASPFDIPPLKDRQEQYRSMHMQDREKFLHTPELYAVWNAKPFFVHAAVTALAQQGREYDYVFWNDAGSFRSEHVYATWPSAHRVEQVWDTGEAITGTPKHKLLFFPLTGLPAARMRHWQEHMGPVDYDVSEGSFFGGSPETIAWWKDVFYAYHDYYLALGLFVGKDQTLINALFLLFPERVFGVWYSDPEATARAGLVPFFDEGALGACGSEWFYYQFWLADRPTRDIMRGIWIERAAWRKWRWWAGRQKCRMTGVVALKDLLSRQFGADWTPPPRTIPLPDLA